MRRQLRLRHRRDFEDVFRRGRSWHNELLVLRTLPNNLEHNRYGFITSQRLGGAVTRNRVRRRLREAVRVLPLEFAWDILISAKAPAARSNFYELKQAVVNLLTRARLMKEEPPAGEEPA